jgi:hypothetical protein
MLEDQQVDVRMGDHGLQTQQAHSRIQDETVPRRPLVSARPADLEGPRRALDVHSGNYKPNVRSANAVCRSTTSAPVFPLIA